MNIQVHIMVGERQATEDGESIWSFDTKVGRCLVSYLDDDAAAAKEALKLVKAELEKMLNLKGA